MEEAKLELSGAQYDYEQFILNSYIDSQSWEGGGEIPLLFSPLPTDWYPTTQFPKSCNFSRHDTKTVAARVITNNLLQCRVTYMLPAELVSNAGASQEQQLQVNA